MSLQRDVSLGNVKPTKVRVDDWDPFYLSHSGEYRLTCHATLFGLQWELWDAETCIATWTAHWDAIQEWKFKVGGPIVASEKR